jgi:hypothetical protein
MQKVIREYALLNLDLGYQVNKITIYSPGKTWRIPIGNMFA